MIRFLNGSIVEPFTPRFCELVAGTSSNKGMDLIEIRDNVATSGDS